MESPRDVTELLVAWGQGDESALSQLVPVVYDELHRLAHRQMAAERTGHTLQTTALVNEVFLRFTDSARINVKDRAHFFALAAQLMRRILVDHARSRGRVKRGGGMVQGALEEAYVPAEDPDLVLLDDALTKLARLDERKGRVVELRFFGGLSVTETAEVLGVSGRTVLRDWDLAKAWLLRELQGTPADATGAGRPVVS